MNCHDVLARVDAMALAEWPSNQRLAAEHHARECTACRSALEAAHALDSGLHRLAEPAPPAGLVADIIAQAARIEEGTVRADAASLVASAKIRGDRLAWAAALGGIAVGLGVNVYGLLAGEAPLHLVSPRIGGATDGLLEMPQPGPAVIVLVAGLLLYLAGLLAPIRGGGRPGQPSAD